MNERLFCRRYGDIVPADFLDEENGCQEYREPSTSADAIEIINAVLETGPMLGPLWIAREVLENIIPVDDQHFYFSVNTISKIKSKKMDFIVKSLLNARLK